MLGDILVAFAASLAVWILLMYVTALIPSSAIRDNVLSSAEYMEENESNFYELKSGDRRTLIHDYADAITLNILYSVDGEDRLSDMITAPFYSDNANEEYPMIRLLEARVADDAQPDTLYDRYWHGMMVYLRPLLLLTDIKGIRIISEILLAGLMIWLSVVLWKRKQKTLTVSLWIAGILVLMPMVGMTMEYLATFLIMLIFSLMVTHFYGDDRKLPMLMAACGVSCAFTDFLTTETVTFVVPMAIAIALRVRKAEEQNVAVKPAAEWKKTIQCGFSWLGSFLMTYIVKWSLSSLILGEDRFTPALQMFFYRQGSQVTQIATESLAAGDISMVQSAALPQPVMAVLLNLKLLTGIGSNVTLMTIFTVMIIAVPILAIFLYLYHRKGPENRTWAILLGLAVIPILRFAILNNHSLEHNFFTYRALFGTIVCLITAAAGIIDRKMLKKKS